MKVPACNIGGEIVKDNETYLLRDNKCLKNLVVSSTLLLPGKETRGHSHAGQEEVYFFVDGKGSASTWGHSGKGYLPINAVSISDNLKNWIEEQIWKLDRLLNIMTEDSGTNNVGYSGYVAHQPDPDLNKCIDGLNNLINVYDSNTIINHTLKHYINIIQKLNVDLQQYYKL